jgi:uncharacterized protein with PQ loop repeat
MIDTAAWIGSLMLAVCAVPQAWASYRQGHSDGVTPGLLWLWGGGEVLTLVYVVDKGIVPMIVNYSFNLILILIITFYKLKPRRK